MASLYGPSGREIMQAQQNTLMQQYSNALAMQGSACVDPYSGLAGLQNSQGLYNQSIASMSARDVYERATGRKVASMPYRMELQRETDEWLS